MRAGDLTTPALLADVGVLGANMAIMSATRPASALRPHVKAFKCTALAGRLAAWRGRPNLFEMLGLSYVFL
ncbi:MAG: hypothetical protein QF844_04280, partial [Acidimicrobiales bacterium]|nr:hypothetical protein [Acidimicrobiales bacterium]